ncbi:MAG: transglycosylase SLT domain-containing protein [Gemmatimonas sp.]
MVSPLRLTRLAAHTAVIAALLSGCGDAVVAQSEPAIRPALRPVSTSDSTVRAATRALEQGRPWEATRMLASLVNNPARRSSAAVLRAAEAASAWEGWDETRALLQNEAWLGKEYGGHGYVLLARALLALSPRSPSTDSLAMQYAQRALPLGANRAERGERETLLARAHERVQNMDSARVHYLRAAQQLSEANDWLQLRAAAVTRSDRSRQDEYNSIRGTVARERVNWTEANARENFGDTSGAASAYEKADDYASAFRLRMLLAGDNKSRANVRRDIIAYLSRMPLPSGARAVVGILDARVVGTAAANFSAADELMIARAAIASGLSARAVTSYGRAFEAGLGDDRDRFRYADALFRLGRTRDAALQFARVPGASTLAGSAAYQRARALLRAGDGTAAKRALLDTRTRFRNDTVAASSSLYLLGDLASDGARESEARQYFVELVRNYPTSSFAPQAALRAALITLIAGNAKQAATELDAFNAASPSHSESLAARYWSGDAWKRAGIDSAARTRWQEVMQRSEASYYAMLAAQRLGTKVWVPSADTSAAPKRYADIDSAQSRAALLEHLGLLDEMRLEDDRIVRDAGTSPDRLLAAARGFAARGNSSRAIGLARRALDNGAPSTVSVYRLLYPVAQEGVLLAEAKRGRLDPALMAALIRQESNFTPHATSVAGARGLMQLMPSVGGALARTAGFTPWDPVLLYQADVNVQLGVRHLSAALKKYPQTGQGLAAYNAGDSRVARWRTKAGGNDPELFVERIPFVETRDYVRIILRNRELYRALYSWPAK